MKTNFAQKRMLIRGTTVSLIAICLGLMNSPAFAAPNSEDDIRAATTPQVVIKARFVEMSTNTDWSQNFNWYPKIDASSKNGTFTTNITESQMQEYLNFLQQRGGADLLNEGQVTTLSGRQAQFQVVDVPDDAMQKSGAAPSAKDQAAASPYGTILDVLPKVTADNSAIEMILIPSVTPRPTTDGKQVHSSLQPIPVNCTVKDGQTVVIGRLPSTDKNAPSCTVVVLVTATLIDPTGNRIHSTNIYDLPMIQ